MNIIKLIAGRSNPSLAEKISEKLDIDLVSRTIEKFPNTEIRVEINEDIRGSKIFIIQTGGSNSITGDSINDYLIETLLLIDACKRSGASSVNVILATYPYARSDKKDKPRVPIAGAVVSRVLEAAGCDRIISMDLHAGQIQGFTTLPFDNLYAIKLHINNLKNNIFKDLDHVNINKKYMLVSLDAGGAKRVKEYAKRLKMSYALMDKQRDYSKPGIVVKSVLVGESIEGKIAICVDDMCDTCGTLVAGVNDLKDHGASGAIVLVTHGIFSGPAIERINECDFIDSVWVIDTLDQTLNMELSDKIKVLGSADLLATVITRIVHKGSISKLFK